MMADRAIILDNSTKEGPRRDMENIWKTCGKNIEKIDRAQGAAPGPGPGPGPIGPGPIGPGPFVCTLPIG